MSLDAQSAEAIEAGNFRAPLKNVTCCMDTSVFSPESGCGEATLGRTHWPNGAALCQRKDEVLSGQRDMRRALEGLTLDILMLPTEDEILLGEPRNGDPVYYYGFVGDILNLVAETGGFEYNAIITRAPHAGDAYDGNWDDYLVDCIRHGLDPCPNSVQTLCCADTAQSQETAHKPYHPQCVMRVRVMRCCCCCCVLLWFPTRVNSTYALVQGPTGST